MTMPQALRRLAMIAAYGSLKTPLTRVNGMETGVLVSGKGDGDVLEMLVVLKGGETLILPLEEGYTDLSPDPNWKAFLFRKAAGDVSTPTTIHVILRG